MLSNDRPRSLSGTTAERPAANFCRAGTIYMDTTTTPPTLYVVAKINNAHVWCSPSDYVPGTPADWVGAPPTTIAEAINRIAALIGPVP